MKPIGPSQELHSLPIRSIGPTPINIADFERYASEYLPKNAFDYYASGSNDMITLAENRKAFERLRILPRILVDVRNISTQTTILGNAVDSPICIAPTAMQKMAHHDGELATSRAAAKHKSLMTLSSWSTTSLEDVASAAPDGYRWFQLYIYKDRKVTLELVRRAEAAGYKALAVTVDTPILGRREADLRNRFSLPAHLTLANFTSQQTSGGQNLASGIQQVGSSGSGLASYVAGQIDRSLNWEDIRWLRRHTTLKIVLKGVLTAEDAVLGVEAGADGIWVSNHGARQLDTSPATIEVLPEICRAVKRASRLKGGDEVEVYLDGGIMRGTDVFKALALGARAVFIGRPSLWGLAHSGEEGVSAVLGLLREELSLSMALAGVTSIEALSPSLIRTASSLRSRL